MTDVDRAIARASEVQERVRARTEARGRRRVEAEVARRVGRIAIADGLIVLAAIVFGLAVMPLGVTGAMVVALLLVLATIAFAVLPTSAPVRVEQLAAVPLKALPARTERWLEAQRPALPSPVRGLVDSIGVKLEVLAPQLAALDEKSSA